MAKKKTRTKPRTRTKPTAKKSTKKVRKKTKKSTKKVQRTPKRNPKKTRSVTMRAGEAVAQVWARVPVEVGALLDEDAKKNRRTRPAQLSKLLEEHYHQKLRRLQEMEEERSRLDAIRGGASWRPAE